LPFLKPESTLPVKTRFLILLLIQGLMVSLSAQSPGTQNYVVRHTQAQVLDSAEGMLIYQHLMKALDLDQQMLQSQGVSLQGWNEDYFDEGQLMRISYYKEGKLVLFKNFFESGQCQNNITYTDPQNCNIDVYFENGNLKHQLHFCNGQPKKMTEFFASGLPKSQLEFDAELGCVSSKRNWYPNAEIQSEIILSDPAARLYQERTFYPHGQLKEEGNLTYSTDYKSYIKTGTWSGFEGSGRKKHSEKFRFSLSAN
jgi:hypothetical protein